MAITAAATGRRNLKNTTIHIMALDGIVNVNSLFTLGLFLGLSVNPADPSYTLVNSSDTSCRTTYSVAENLVSFHVYSFSSFLFSSLIAFGLKQAVRTVKDGDTRVEVSDGIIGTIGHVNLRVLRVGMLASAAGSVFGCVFLTLALVNLVQIKLGKLGCLDWYGVAAVGPLVVLVPTALAGYICIVLHAFTR